MDIVMLGKCYPLNELREDDTTVQNTHAEHYRESDNWFSNKYF